MKRTHALETVQKTGETVLVNGWVHRTRRMGKIVFIDLRDMTGLLQIVFDASLPEAKNLRPEFVVEVEGKIVSRQGKNANPKEPTGTVELQALKLTVLNTAETPPFEIDNEDRKASEELRLTYRYLDLRHERMQRNIRTRHAVIAYMRKFLGERNFVEIETPILTKGTPEGAREYIVPARLYPGEFYVLPQAPQQFKQLLMVSGFERYFQIARCFRDEDARGDRQPEHTQLDIEMSFVREEDVFAVVEELFTSLVEALFPHKHISQKPWPRIPYTEAMKRYGTDKPDLRTNPDDPNELAFGFITQFPMFAQTAGGKITFQHNPFSMPLLEYRETFDQDPLKAVSHTYDLVLNGIELASGSIRMHDPDMQRRVFRVMGLTEAEIGERFGHLLRAFRYGTPPHGGIAPGIDRFLMVLMGEPSIREVIAFPKTTDAKDLMMGAPSPLPPEQLREVHIQSTDRRKTGA